MDYCSLKVTTFLGPHRWGNQSRTTRTLFSWRCAGKTYAHWENSQRQDFSSSKVFWHAALMHRFCPFRPTHLSCRRRELCCRLRILNTRRSVFAGSCWLGGCGHQRQSRRTRSWMYVYKAPCRSRFRSCSWPMPKLWRRTCDHSTIKAFLLLSAEY